MQVGDLNFQLGLSGTREVKEEVDDVISKVKELAGVAEALDGKDIDITTDVDTEKVETAAKTIEADLAGAADEAKESIAGIADAAEEGLDFDSKLEIQGLESALSEIRTSDRILDLDPDFELSEARESLQEIETLSDLDVQADVDLGGLLEVESRLARLEGRSVEIDVETDLARGELAAGNAAIAGIGARVDRSGSDTILDAFRQQGLSENLSRLNDEAFAIASILSGLGSAIVSTTGAIVTLTASALATAGAAGGLGAAATALATQFGDTDIRSDVLRLKGAFQGVAREFVETFEPLIRNQIIPAGLALAQEIRNALPQLKEFTKRNLPTVLTTFVGLVDETVGLLQGFSTLTSVLDILIESIELVIQGIPALLQQIGSIGGPGADIQGAVDDFKESLRSIESSAETISGRDFGAQTATDELRKELVPILGEQGARNVLQGNFGLEGVGGGLKKFEDIRKEIRGIQRLTEETTESGEPLRTEAEAIKDQFRLAQKAVEGLAKKGLTDTQQFRDFKSLLADIRKRAEEAGVELGNAGQAAESFSLDFVKTAEERRAAFEEATQDNTINALGAPIADVGSKLPGSLSGGAPSLSNALRLGQAADSVSEVNGLINSIRSNFDLLANQEAVNVVGKLQAVRENLQGATDQAKQLPRALTQQGIQALQQLTQGIGSEIGGALFADQGRLDRLRSRRRSIQQNLRQARRSGNFQQVRQLSNELDRVNNKLNQTQSIFGRLGQAVKGFGQVFKQVLQQVISRLISAALLSAVISSFTSGGFIGTFTGLLGGGGGGGLPAPGAVGQVGAGIFPSAATGGFVMEGGFAQIHKGEAIVSKKMLDSGFATQSTAGALSTGSATIEGGAIRIPVEMVDQAQKRGNTNRKRTGRKA